MINEYTVNQSHQGYNRSETSEPVTVMHDSSTNKESGYLGNHVAVWKVDLGGLSVIQSLLHSVFNPNILIALVHKITRLAAD